jgi:hypothetical protein
LRWRVVVVVVVGSLLFLLRLRLLRNCGVIITRNQGCPKRSSGMIDIVGKRGWGFMWEKERGMFIRWREICGDLFDNIVIFLGQAELGKMSKEILMGRELDDLV